MRRLLTLMLVPFAVGLHAGEIPDITDLREQSPADRVEDIVDLRLEGAADNTSSAADPRLVSIYARMADLERRQTEDEFYIGALTITASLACYFCWSYLDSREDEMEPHDEVVRDVCKAGTIGLPAIYGLKKLSRWLHD